MILSIQRVLRTTPRSQAEVTARQARALQLEQNRIAALRASVKMIRRGNAE